MTSKKHKGTAVRKAADERDIPILQAVVITDSYQTRFRPLTREAPRCLLPLAGTPLIDYTLEFLTLAGVEDVFIFVHAHADQVEKYIRSSKWNQPSSPFSTCQIVLSPTSMSLGDCMRELDARRLIEGDFLLVNGDCITNIPLEGVLKAHRERRLQNKNAIMTMILKEADLGHRTKNRDDMGVFVIDEANNRCVHYEEPDVDTDTIEIPPDLLKSQSLLSIRTNLIDCQLDICSQDVPALFTENFDYNDIRRHFVHSILNDYDLYGKTIHTHIVTDHYAARVRSLQTYDAVTRDIMSRWTYPLVPDSNLGGGSFRYRRFVYLEDGVNAAQSASIKRNCIIGEHTMIGDNTIIAQSVLGKRCRIGKNCVLDQCYVWDDVTIGDGCKLQRCIVASGSTLDVNVIVAPGSIIPFGYSVSSNTIVPSSAFFSAKELPTEKSADDNLDSDSEDGEDQALLSQSGLLYSLRGLAVSSASSISTIPGVDSDADDSDFSSSRKQTLRPRSDSTVAQEADEDFYKEASTSLLAAMEGHVAVDVASLELNSLRMTANTSQSSVRRVVACAFVRRIEQIALSSTMTKAAAHVLVTWKELVRTRCIRDKADQVDFIAQVQRECCGRTQGPSILLQVLQKLYDLDLVEEDAVIRWWFAGADGDVNMLDVRKMAGKFVDWLKEADSESGEDDDDGEVSDE